MLAFEICLHHFFFGVFGDHEAIGMNYCDRLCELIRDVRNKKPLSCKVRGREEVEPQQTKPINYLAD